MTKALQFSEEPFFYEQKQYKIPESYDEDHNFLMVFFNNFAKLTRKTKFTKMPHTTYWEDKGMLIEWSGVIEAKEVLKSNGSIYGDRRFDEIRYQINDLLNAEYATFTEKEINIISALELQASDWNRYMKMIHITKDPKLIDDIKQYEKRMEASGWEFLICSTLDEARLWVSAS